MEAYVSFPAVASEVEKKKVWSWSHTRSSLTTASRQSSSLQGLNDLIIRNLCAIVRGYKTSIICK